MLEVCADLNAFVPGRPIDDDGAAFLRYENGVVGTLTASQVAVGEENNIRIRIYGVWNGSSKNRILYMLNGRINRQK